MRPYRLLDLFSGIGGFSLGLERTGGFKTVAFCEIDPFCRRVLAKHWPEVPQYHDVTTLTGERLAADGVAVDAICGGFPCQDISTAGTGVGIGGTRSGLWHEYARIIEEVGPQVAIIENAAVLRSRGLETVLRCLDEIGYDAEWHCVPASAVGAPHSRDRLWILAYPANQIRREETRSLVAREGTGQAETCRRPIWQGLWGAGHDGPTEGRANGDRFDHWDAEPALDRVADGDSSWLGENYALGNAVVPQIPELIGRAILTSRLAA